MSKAGQGASFPAPSPAAPGSPAPSPARAYCGPAHGHCWTVDVDGSPPDLVELPVESRPVRYRLTRQPSTGLPVRDHLGNYLYVPVQHDLDLTP